MQVKADRQREQIVSMFKDIRWFTKGVYFDYNASGDSSRFKFDSIEPDIRASLPQSSLPCSLSSLCP